MEHSEASRCITLHHIAGFHGVHIVHGKTRNIATALERSEAMA
jgi:hypothetical protein